MSKGLSWGTCILANAGILKPSGRDSPKRFLEGGGRGVYEAVLPQTSTLVLIHLCLHWPGLKGSCTFLKDPLCAKHTYITAPLSEHS